MSYNGYKNWETYNVALWLYNTEALYADVKEAIRRNPRLIEAAEYMMDELGYAGASTLDGAEFTLGRIGDAIADDHEEWWNEADNA